MRTKTFRPAVEQLEDRQLLALTITPTFDTTITSDPNAATIEASINTVIAAYKNAFSDNVRVNITFQEGAGLGGNSTFRSTVSYASYLAALKSRSTSADDIAAVASLPPGPNLPIAGTASNTNISVTSALARALGLVHGLPTPLDSTITLNTSIMNLSRTGPQNPADYDLMAVCAHEIDEALGGGSGLDDQINGAAIFSTTLEPLDLFRYSAPGVRSYNTTAATTAFFSINGGKTNLVGFNQFSPDANTLADFGDWFSGNAGQGALTPEVQDAFDTPGATPILGVELRRLDVLGFTRAVTPPPVVTAPSAQVDTPGSPLNVNLGSFTGGNGPWKVDVSWGDGTPDTVFNVGAIGNLGSQLHTYATAGSFLPKVTVTDFTSVSGSATFTVADSTTSIALDAAKDLVITDIAAGGKNDALTIQYDTANTQYIIADPSASGAFSLVGAVPGATISADKHTAIVPYAAVTGTKIDFNTLAGNDSLTIDTTLGSLPAGKAVIYNGGVGSNTLVGPNANNSWIVTGANAGQINGAVSSFVNVENLTGGTGRDVFTIDAAASLAGRINGGAGSNWLDYAGITSGVIVNLTTGASSRITAGVASINNVIGSAAGGDHLTGNSAGGILIGHGAGNTITAGSGRSILIGGAGVNSLIGGAGDDLIIDGHTSYDYNLTALETILTTWQGPLTYAQRVAALQAAGPDQLKVGATVFLSPGRTVGGVGPRFGSGPFVYASTLRGNGGSDWFFTALLVSVIDRTSGETVTI